MTQRFFSIFFLVNFILLSSCKRGDENAVLQEIYSDVEQNFESYNILKKSCETIGHRMSGSENGKKAEELIFSTLKSYGYEPKFDEFKVNAWYRDTLSLSFSSKKLDYQVESVCLAFSPLFVDTNATIIDLGNGLKTDFESQKKYVIGNFVLVNLYMELPYDSGAINLHRTEKTALAIKYGALGVVFINHPTGNVLLTGTASMGGDLLPIPAVCVSRETGEELRELLKREEVICSIYSKNSFNKVTARNVYATLNGKKKEKIVIGAHLDSWDLSTGAIDNGIGSFSILDMARVLKKYEGELAHSIQFSFWMGEEQGLLGSKHFVEFNSLTNKLADIKYYINIDMSGNPKGFDIQGRPEAAEIIASIGNKIKMVDSTFANEQSSTVGLHSDHQAFMMKGVPVMQLIGNLEPAVYKYYHSNRDDMSLVNKAHMKKTSSRLALFLYLLASEEEIEVPHYSEEETKNMFVKAGLKEKMQLANDWIWND